MSADPTPDPSPTPAEPRWRLDAVALALLAGGAAVAAGVALYRPLTGVANPLGPTADVAAAAVVDALGAAAAVLVVGWFTLVALYVARRGPGRLLVRAAGWVTLTATAAVAADLAGRALGTGPASAFGTGGSVGAYLRFALEDRLASPLPAVAVAAGGFVGLLLAADGLVKAVAVAVWAVARRLAVAAVRGNTWVARGGDRLIAGVARLAASWRERRARRRAAAEAEVADLLPLSPPPASGEGAGGRGVGRNPSPDPSLEVGGEEDETPEPTNPADIPITRPAPPPAAALRLLPDDTAAPPANAPGYELPPLSLLADPDPFPVSDHEQKLRDRAVVLEKSFLDFGLNVKVVGIHTGPVVTQYEVALETGLRLNKVTALSDDLALTLAVPSVRIVAPLPGRTTVGIEVPNDHRQTVRLKEVILATANKAAKYKLPIYLGKDVEGRPLAHDMADMPHLLIAGRTGTGKSVCLNTVLLSFLFTRSPEECRLILIDPKQVEFSDYGQIPHLMTPVVVKNEKAEAILAWAVDKMEERYELLRRARVRNIASYNELGWAEVVRRVDPQTEDERKELPPKLPYIVIVIDEVGDLIMAMKKEVESHIIRLAQKSRAAGIHLILATQRPTVDVITGLIKSNLPARICFQVASRNDSAVVLDEKGAEKLLGMGDMLFLQPKTSTIVRGQGAYADDQEIARVTEALSVYEPNFESELLNLKSKDAAGGGEAAGDFGEQLRARDALYEQAIDIVVREQRGSTSLLQRALGIGYGRASRLIDFMAEDGLVGAYNGSSARDVLLSPEEWEGRKKGA